MQESDSILAQQITQTTSTLDWKQTTGHSLWAGSHLLKKEDVAMAKNQAAGKAAHDGVVHVTEDQIRMRAYEKFCKRGDGPGDQVADWLDAEGELFEEERTHLMRPNRAVASAR